MSAIDLIVLGMIKEKAQSAYEIQKNVDYRNISKWVKVSTPSIYKKVLQLEQKGYIKGTPTKAGNMSEKSVYKITKAGQKYFLELMKKNSEQMVSVFLDFNAVIINMDFLSEAERAEVLQNIQNEIEKYKTAVTKLEKGRTDIPPCAKTILKQQSMLSRALSSWVKDFGKTYLGK